MNSDPKSPPLCPACGKPMQLSWQRAALGQSVYVCRPCNKEVAVLPDT